ncbi:MAG TPA: 2-oxoacid:ferredoxin oxidoreductase subunit beta [Candidatus Paceibacterota bacterium]|nr:2-oxoacid:ferredoxin oxidoreductase subunit beta [Verrucomicrobiota bacterium]HRZ46930.1 2-oxoacid:ferredoxin oxidoreductase subunit beta [Candidatus Paceibacterota bacterium]HRZ92489.1 2-oxoacid:ferredoxin oxidoreductase subunit beta [Candidatus Paceibacterota bacterium]
MTASTPVPAGSQPFTTKDYRSNLKPIWCAGCGDFGVATALYRALAAVGRPPHEIALVSGIGCSSRIPGYTNCYGFNSIHGRALPIAQGIKLANPDLLVLVAGGDGDGFSIGGNHVAHAIRRNVDLTYICMDNQIYGLTKGQLSPTSPRGLKTVSSSYGSFEEPVNPLLYCLAYGAGFVAQGAPADMDGLTALIEAGIRYPGFAFINVQSPCVTYGEEKFQLKAQKLRLEKLEALGHDPADFMKATERARAYGEKLYTGIYYRCPSPAATFESMARERRQELQSRAASRSSILDLFQTA